MIKIVCVGKIKESFIRDGIEEYLKRMTKYTKVQLIEVEDVSIGNKENILLKEANKILDSIKDNEYVVALNIIGQQYDSIALANLINKQLGLNPNITFVIGGSYGLHESVINRSAIQLSFSKLTFPHQLFRLILVEQLYRVFKIVNNETYHK